MKHPTPEIKKARRLLADLHPADVRSAMLVFFYDLTRHVWIVQEGIGGPEVTSYGRARDCQAYVIAGNTAKAIAARVARKS